MTPFEQMGGAEGIAALVNRFYDRMDTSPETATIRKLHAASLKSSREKLTLYLTGWTGGPPVYVERFGQPMLRARHLPFSIGEKERDEWLWCMDQSLDAHPMPDDLRETIRGKLHALADHMRNRAVAGLPVLDQP